MLNFLSLLLNIWLPGLKPFLGRPEFGLFAGETALPAPEEIENKSQWREAQEQYGP